MKKRSILFAVIMGLLTAISSAQAQACTYQSDCSATEACISWSTLPPFSCVPKSDLARMYMKPSYAPAKPTLLSRLASILTPTASTIKDQCAKPDATTCTLMINGMSQFGLCTKSPTSENKRCTPAAYVRAPQAIPTNTYTPPQPTGMKPCNTNTKSALDCAEPNEESWEFKNGNWSTTCSPKKNNSQPKTGGNGICALPEKCSIDADGSYKYGASRDSQACKDALKLVDLTKC